MTRSENREIAFKTIFAYISSDDFNLDNVIEIARKDKNLSADEYEFIATIIKNLEEHFDELKERIQNNSGDFIYSRIYKVDLALIYLALVEVNYMGTPIKVAVNEVLNLAKAYSTPESAKYINGVVANIIKSGN